MKPLILHISNDYPDPLQPDKTRAILHLVEATPEFRHVVYSLNRVNGWSGIADVAFGEDRIAVAYGALPKGLFWEGRLDAVADWIIADLRAKKIVPDLVEAHKLTVEGLIGQRLATEFSCPLICDIQGGTDVKILRAKGGLHKRFRTIAEQASVVFPYAPWALEPFSRTIGLRRDKCMFLPVLPGFDTLSPSVSAGSNRLVTMMRFSTGKNKNIKGLMAAVKHLAPARPSLTLDVYGGGSPDSLLRIKKQVRDAGMEDRIIFCGSIANDRLPGLLGQYAALVMPSFSETYGLVYAEALFCGVPVLFSKGRAIDGYFDEKTIGYACDPRSDADIAAGIDDLLSRETELKRGIARMQKSGVLDPIRRKGIIETYRSGLNAAMGSLRKGIAA